MRLATRLWLLGALLPVAVMALVLFVADRLFHLALERSLDQALLAQAAIESVSLFDGPKREPHLHMASSPLVESVRPFAPEGVLFGPDGHEVTRYPPPRTQRGREVLHPGKAGEPPALSTRERAGVRERVLVVTVRSPSGAPYTLRLVAAMTLLDAAIETFHRMVLFALIVTALVLLLVQTFQARSLRRRLAQLTTHVDALRTGDLSRPLAPEAARDELAALRDVLSQATRSLREARDTKERLVADAAHELRTPLTLMRTGLDLALRRERSNEELKSALHDTREEVDRLAALASRLLDVASIAREEQEPERCDVAELVHHAVDSARPEAEARALSLTLRSPEHIEALVRPEAVRRAIDNLLSNALKYAVHSIEVVLETAAHGLVLKVRDDGPGIPAAERELVFEPFHRVRGSAPGAGLGLAIVREVARAHGGRAYVEPTDGGAELILEIGAGPSRSA